MKRCLHTKLLAVRLSAGVFSCGLATCSYAPERILYTQGHADLVLELLVVDGRTVLDAYLASHGAIIGGDVVHGAVALEDIAIWSSARFSRPTDDGGAFDGLCVSDGEELVWLPQGLRDASGAGVPFLGIAAATAPVLPAEGAVEVHLVGVESPSGGGAYSLWRDGFPPVFFLSSCSEADPLEVPFGHDHYNMGFTERGKWSLTYEAFARLSNGERVSARFRVHYVLD